MYEALGVKNIDSVLVKPMPPAPKDPALEHIDALAGRPFQAFLVKITEHMTAHRILWQLTWQEIIQWSRLL